MHAERLSQMIKHKPISSAQLAVSWVEFLAKFGKVDNMLPESRYLSNIQYYSLDVIAFLVTALVLFLYIFYQIFRCIFVRICCRSRRSARKAKND